mmetsp:Transcript_12332/g.47550  ORF Transcript_12332/g.47550 Transcript_12332/m.47550 type:complete len:213 (-) Transcript_12332:1651-2289(-)
MASPRKHGNLPAGWVAHLRARLPRVPDAHAVSPACRGCPALWLRVCGARVRGGRACLVRARWGQRGRASGPVGLRRERRRRLRLGRHRERCRAAAAPRQPERASWLRVRLRQRPCCCLRGPGCAALRTQPGEGAGRRPNRAGVPTRRLPHTLVGVSFCLSPVFWDRESQIARARSRACTTSDENWAIGHCKRKSQRRRSAVPTHIGEQRCTL